MRILLLNHRYWPFRGGSETVTQRLAEHLAACGHHVDVITTTAHDLEALWDPDRRRVDAPAFERLNEVTIHRVDLAYRPFNRWLFPIGHRLQGELARFGTPARIQRKISQILLGSEALRAAASRLGPFDLVMATNLGLDALALEGAKLAKNWDVPYVLIPFLHIGVDSDAVARRYSSMSHQVELLQHASLIICMTEIEAAFLRALQIDTPFAVTGAGIDIADVTGGDGVAVRDCLGVTGTLVGGIGAMASGKGTFDTIRAVQTLRSEGVDVEAVFIGPGESEFNAFLHKLSPRDREGIHVLGMVDDDQRRDVLAALDFMCLPSRTESFGIVYLEAWVNDCPVIGVRAGGVPAIINHGCNGLLVEFGRPDQIADAIRQLIDQQDLAERLATAGRKLALSTYTWPVVLGRMTAAIEASTGLQIGGQSHAS